VTKTHRCRILITAIQVGGEKLAEQYKSHYCVCAVILKAYFAVVNELIVM
jgi:hypothetical protein